MSNPELREELHKSSTTSTKETTVYSPYNGNDEYDKIARSDKTDADALLKGLEDGDNPGNGTIYEKYKDFNFDNVLTFPKNGSMDKNGKIEFKDGVVKQDEIGNYIELKGVKFYDIMNPSFDGGLPNNLHYYSKSDVLFHIEEIKDGKHVGKGLQINRDKDITDVKMR